jgi:SAM-dependent methyltransferase
VESERVTSPLDPQIRDEPFLPIAIVMADPTFSTSSASQAQQYAATRGSSYPAELYKTILDFHNTGSGPNNSSVFALDVGCGPGNAARDLAMYFDRVIGVDPSAEMINTARKKLQELEEPWKDFAERVTFQVCGAEGIDTLEGVEEGSVDVITAAMAVGSSSPFASFHTFPPHRPLTDVSLYSRHIGSLTQHFIKPHSEL